MRIYTVPPPTQAQVLIRKARRADVYWSTLGPAHGAGLATSPVENAADEVPPHTFLLRGVSEEVLHALVQLVEG